MLNDRECRPVLSRPILFVIFHFPGGQRAVALRRHLGREIELKRAKAMKGRV